MTTSRFKLMDAPAKDPGCCWITKTSVGPFIDTGVDLSLGKIDRGRIYLSVDALREMAQVAGLFDEEEPKAAALKKKQWYEEGYNDAMKELQSDVVNNFVERVLSGTASTAGAAVSEPSETNTSTAGAAVPNASDTAGDASQVDSDVDGLERESTGVGSVKRPASVSTSSSDDAAYRL